ncbi:MAG: hypothetical protein HFG22_17315 [Lachnospiraceae bacterium]|nr:hypothetical protein [Lachnospiraceae bacterium]
MNEKQYTIGLRKRINGDRFFQHDAFLFEEVRINTSGRYWMADPFLFEKDGRVYLFYEAYDLIIQRGYIGYSIIREDGTTTDPKMIIKGHHKSFPYIYENDEGIFIMPESCVDHNIRLFRAVDFPNEWKEERIIIEDIFSVDSILLHEMEKDYLLTSEQYRYPSEEKVISCWVKNRLLEISGDLTIDPLKITGRVVVEGDKGVRNAGAVFYHDHKLVRPGQNCEDGRYGKGLKFFEINSIDPYTEKLIYEIDCDEMQRHISFFGKKYDLIGVHTYNSSENYEVIDLSYWENLRPWVVLFRFGTKAMRKVYHGYKKGMRSAKEISDKIKRRLSEDQECYPAIIDAKAPWVFVSYITDPFYHKKDDAYLDAHQNKREVIAMAEVFNKLGYNAYFMLYTSQKPLPDIDCKLIFGHEPNIQRAKEKYKDARMIFYGVSTYFEYRNKKIKEMTDKFNDAYKANVPYRRMVEPYTAVDDADGILLIGSEKTLETFPEKYRSKVTKIHQSTQTCGYLRNVEAHGSKEFFYLASYGNVLKGVYPVLSFFARHPEYELHWVGPIEEDVREAIKNWITSNIHIYGYQDIGSNITLGLMERCDFMLYPSGAEGGVPGSVLNAMKSGLIPLVTPWASFDGIEDHGFLMEDATVDGVSSAVDWAMSLSLDEIDRRKKVCQRFVLENYNLKRFTQEFEDYMRKQLK